LDSRFSVFVSCLPGLEPLLGSEVAELGQSGEAMPGGVAVSGDRRLIYRANLELGLATHVLVRVGEFRVRGLGELVRKTRQLAWDRVLLPGTAVEVRATSRRSRLYHTGAIVQRVREGIEASLGQPPAREPAARLVVRLDEDHCVVSLDTSGDPLHRRGWRLETGKAPLREDLAHALIASSGWDREGRLVDPFCGSGTIAIEAATMARRLAPGRMREFGFEHTVLFDAELLAEVRTEAESRAIDSGPLILASDRDAGSVERARRNAERAGVAGDIRFEHASMTACSGFTETGGWLVTNPPFGQRLGNKQALRNLYQALGTRVSECKLDVALLASDRRLALASGLPLATAFLTDHGGTKVRAMVASRAAW